MKAVWISSRLDRKTWPQSPTALPPPPLQLGVATILPDHPVPLVDHPVPLVDLPLHLHPRFPLAVQILSASLSPPRHRACIQMPPICANWRNRFVAESSTSFPVETPQSHTPVGPATLSLSLRLRFPPMSLAVQILSVSLRLRPLPLALPGAPP